MIIRLLQNPRKKKEYERKRGKLGKNGKCYPLAREIISRENKTYLFFISTNMPVALYT